MFNAVILCLEETPDFSYKFKPLIKLDNRTFIEHCMDNLLKYDDVIETYRFIVTDEQDELNGFEDFLHFNFKNISKKIIVYRLFNNTEGPYQALLKFINNNSPRNLIVCDCDCSINIQPLIRSYNTTVDVMMTFSEKIEGDYDCEKVAIKDKQIYKIYKGKDLPDMVNFKLTGCYFFKNTGLFEREKYSYFSEFLENNHQKFEIKLVEIKEAYFFKTPEMLEKTILERKNLETIVLNIDDILIKHNEQDSNDVRDNILIGDCVNVINKLYEKKMIILMSSRPENKKKDLMKLLSYYGIKFHKIILQVNPGTKYLVGAIQPWNVFTRQALAINLERDKGIDDLVFEENLNNDIEIIKTFNEHIFVMTRLIKFKSSDILSVRKSIIKNKNNNNRYFSLKRQYEDIKRMEYYTKLTPQIFKDCDNDYIYYYDMEYLENYDNLDKYNEKIIQGVLKSLLNNFKNELYSIRKINTDKNYWEDLLTRKVYPILEKYEKENSNYNHLINSKTLIINNKKYKGIRTLFKKINFKEINPKFLSPIHGDLNLSNIMFNDSTNEYKIINTGENDYLDFPGFDLGNLFKSIITKYNEWKMEYELILEGENGNIECDNNYFDYNLSKVDYISKIYSEILQFSLTKTKKIGIICMAMSLILFLPFIGELNSELSYYSLILSLVWLNNHALT